MLPVGIPFVLGRRNLVTALFTGMLLAMLLDGYLLYRMFDSDVLVAPVDRVYVATIKAGASADVARR